ncbi:MAG: dihydrolipoyl dehydrogenase [Pseudomonadota bacterium]
MDRYDIVVIGAGPGGYVAAIRAAQLGFRTACIEGWTSAGGEAALGGTCLNVGCIPSKALLDSSHHFEHMTKHAKEHGIQVTGLGMDVPTMQKRKDKIVQALTQGIAGLFKKNQVAWLKGTGRLAGGNEVAVMDAAGKETSRIMGTHVVIATGSVPMQIACAKVDQQRIVDSTGALSFEAVPKTLGVIGGGVIGLELGSVWRRLGAKVTIFEAMPEFLPSVDRGVAKEAQKLFTRQGLDIRLGAKVLSAKAGKNAVSLEVELAGKAETLEVERLVVAVGRAPRTSDLGAAEVGLALDSRGFIKVDEGFRTNLPGIYAIGDVIGGPMLAHKASEEGVALAEMLAGQKPEVDHSHIPWVIYTWPEIAWAGATEQSLKAEGRAYKVGKFPFLASGRARAMGETDGFVKVLSDATDDSLLGVHCLGPNASELIAEAVITMAFGGSAEDIARTVHAHPTLAESLHEAALGTDGRMIHL